MTSTAGGNTIGPARRVTNKTRGASFHQPRPAVLSSWGPPPKGGPDDPPAEERNHQVAHGLVEDTVRLNSAHGAGYLFSPQVIVENGGLRVAAVSGKKPH